MRLARTARRASMSSAPITAITTPRTAIWATDAPTCASTLRHAVPAIPRRHPHVLRKKREYPELNGHIWVPIDDTTTWVYNWACAYDQDAKFSEENVIERETFYGRGPDDVIPATFRLKANKSNDYFIDRQTQKTKTFTGIKGINTQDFALQEGMGPITDRSQEHLGTSDKAMSPCAASC